MMPCAVDIGAQETLYYSNRESKLRLLIAYVIIETFRVGEVENHGSN